MFTAWETTEEDILNCLEQMGKKLTPEEVTQIHGDLNHHAIMSAALIGEVLEDQVGFAYDEIKDQIKKMNF